MKRIFVTLLIAAAVQLSFAQSATKQKEQTPTHSHDGHDHSHEPQTVAPQSAPNPNAPKITFKEETFDFGSIPEGPQVTHEFKFRNEGKEPLILTSVKASCGCTTPAWPKEPILPGKDGVITATYNTQGRPGPFTKSITITSNSAESSRVIFIKGEVVKAEQEKTVPVAEPNMLAPK